MKKVSHPEAIGLAGKKKAKLARSLFSLFVAIASKQTVEEKRSWRRLSYGKTRFGTQKQPKDRAKIALRELRRDGARFRGRGGGGTAQQLHAGVPRTKKKKGLRRPGQQKKSGGLNKRTRTQRPSCCLACLAAAFTPLCCT